MYAIYIYVCICFYAQNIKIDIIDDIYVQIDSFSVLTILVFNEIIDLYAFEMEIIILTL